MSHVAGMARKAALTTWERFWYVLMCIWFGAGYFSKIPAKKAMHDFGLTEMTGAEEFWYVLMCIWFGAGYFFKIPTAKALSELPQFRSEVRTNLGTLSPAPPPQPPPPIPAPPSVAELSEQSLQMPAPERAPRHQRHDPDEQSEPPDSAMPS